MVRKLSLAIAMALGVTPFGVCALGLGDIHLKSALNQSLNADIELLSVENEEIEDIRVKLASPDAFERAGVERPYFLADLKFKPERRPDGRTVIRVSSRKPVKEPFLDFLVEVNWPQGRMLREYTVLLDPPVTLDRPPAPVARPEIAAATPRRSLAKATQPASAFDPGQGLAGEYGPTRPNDTLWGIAKQVRQPGATMEQMMMALFNANPRAFIKRNINKLRIGKVLQVPPREEVMALTPGEARSAFRTEVNAQPVVRREQPEIEPAVPAAELKIASARPQEEAGVEEGADQAAVTDQLREDLIAAQEARQTALEEGLTLKSRVEELQAQLEQMQRLLNLKDDELAGLQMTTGVAQDQAQPAKEPDIAAAEESGPAMKPEQIELDIADDGEEAAAESEAIFVDEGDNGEVVAEDATPIPTSPVVEKAEPAPAAVAKIGPSESEAAEKAKAKPKKEQTLLQRIAGDTTLIGVAAAVVLVLLALIWALFNRRRSAREEFKESILVDTLGEQAEVQPEAVLEPTPPATDESSFLSDFSPSDIDSLQDETGEVDPLAEADVYIAYGRYKQAEELVRQAIERDPQRMDLKLKLLEILFATRDADAYTALAQQMADQGMAKKDPGGWERVFSMGTKLAPASALFAATGAMAAAESDDISALEDELRGIGSLGADHQVGTSEESDSLGSLDDLDLDLGGLDELGDLTSFGGESLTDDSGMDFDLSGSEQTGGSTAQDEDTLTGLEGLATGRETLAELDLGVEVSEEQSEDDRVLSLDDLEETVQGDLPNELELGDTLNIPLDDLESLEQEPGLGQEGEPGRQSAEAENIDSADALELPDNSELPLPEEVMVGDEVDTKLDLAQAYVEMGDAEGARSILDEVLAEGSRGQKQEAQKMLGQLA